MSRSDGRSRGLRRRSSRIVPASVVAVVLAAIGVLAVITAVLRLSQGSWPNVITGSAAAVAGLTWGSAAVIAAGAVIAALGLILFVAAVKPGSFRSARLQTPPGSAVGQTDYVMSNRAMARLAAARADSVDGVDGVSASASGRKVKVRVTTSSQQRDEIRNQVCDGVGRAFAAAGVQPAPRVDTSVRTKGI